MFNFTADVIWSKVKKRSVRKVQERFQYSTFFFQCCSWVWHVTQRIFSSRILFLQHKIRLFIPLQVCFACNSFVYAVIFIPVNAVSDIWPRLTLSRSTLQFETSLLFFSLSRFPHKNSHQFKCTTSIGFLSVFGVKRPHFVFCNSHVYENLLSDREVFAECQKCISVLFSGKTEKREPYIACIICI